MLAIGFYFRPSFLFTNHFILKVNIMDKCEKIDCIKYTHEHKVRRGEK